MVRWLLLLLLLLSAPLGAEPWSPARDYWGPEDAEGFFRPQPRPASAEPPPVSRPDLQVIALNQKGFVHRGRRQAEGLGSDPLLLQEPARIYSPSQSFLALRSGPEALIILHPQTSVEAQPMSDRWHFSFTGDRGLARLSTHEHTITVAMKPADPKTPWQNHELQLYPGSDLYLIYNRESLLIYVLRGRIEYRIEPTVLLEPIRPPGLLQEWEQHQLRRPPKAPYEIDVFAGQEMQLIPGSVLNFQIGLPHAETWQSSVLRSSPQLGETIDLNNPSIQTMLELRKNWLKLWSGSEPASRETVSRRLEEGRWEEAYELLKTLEPGEENQALEIICLYRLQQERLAEKKRADITPSNPMVEILRQESLRARLRRRATRELRPPPYARHAAIPLEELYLLASHEQANRRWRSALDLWERWPPLQGDAILQQSYKEWQRHLDQKKPWAFLASTEIGWSDNVLHLPSGMAAPSEISHRSSWLVRSSLTLPYLVERSDDYSVHLEPSFAFTVYQHIGLADLQRLEPGLGLPLRIQLPFGQQSLRLKPYISRLVQGSGGLDRFGYDLHWQVPEWTFAPEFSWSQEQNLDFAPTVEHRLDALSGERTSPIDRSVRRNTLGVRSGAVELFWQSWDYRYAGSQVDDRQRLMFRGTYQHEFPYDLQLNIQGLLYQDLFKGERASVTGIHLRPELVLLRWQRLWPTLAAEREMRQSGDRDHAFNETLWLGGVQYRW